MRYIILIAFFALSYTAKAGDSTEVTLTLQSRDWSYMGTFLPAYENVWDSVKVKYRPNLPATFLTPVAVKGYTCDFISIYTQLNNNETALKSNTVARMKTALNAIGDAYITAIITAIDVADAATFDTMKLIGRNKLGRIK